MATTSISTENTYTGDGSTTLFPFNFAYISATDVKVTVDDVLQTVLTDYTLLVNTKNISFTTAPANGAAVRIYRETPQDATVATFFPGSAIRAQDLNNNFLQTLYVTQEGDRDVSTAEEAAEEAVTKAEEAITTANQALADSSQALTDSATALATANTAISAAGQAVTTAEAAEATADQAASDAAAALDSVAAALQYEIVADVASIPNSPSGGDAVQVIDSTGIESFTPLEGLPDGFVGNSALYVRLVYQGSTWVWQDYNANDPESRYLKPGDVNPVYFDSQADFPDPTTFHGGVAHSHADGAMYFAHGGGWVKLADETDIDPNNAVLNVDQTFTGTQTFSAANITAATIHDQYTSGNYSAIAKFTTTAIDCSLANYFYKAATSDETYTFTNVPAGAYSFVFELDYNSGTLTWPSSVKWPGDTPPEPTAGTTQVYVFITDDEGARWRGAVLADYVD